MSDDQGLLLALPSDVLLSILQQATLGPRDLCRLEATCSTFQTLIDDSVWQNAFLHRRRTNALHTPQTWKEEYARRDTWSRGWREISQHSSHFAGHAGPASADGTQRSLLAGPTQKLRRFALKMMSGAQLSATAQYGTHVVDYLRAEAGDVSVFATIGEAIAHARPFDTILVAPGTYHERLHIDKPVELVGTGHVGSAFCRG
jgi:hypothetical protein